MLAEPIVGTRSLVALLPDLAAQPGPRYRALSDALAALLLDGRISPGSRLPSERDLARALGVSRATATAAFDALAADGLLLRRQGSGSFLTLPAAARVTGPGSRMARSVGTNGPDDVLDLSIASLPAVAGVIPDAVSSIAGQLARYSLQRGYYPYGLPELREVIAERFVERGVPTDPAQILVTNGAQHAFDLILQVGVNPGDRVLTELPSYPGALEAIKAHSARHVPVALAESMLAGRWEMPTLPAALRQSSPRLAYLIPDFHNPTGALADETARDQVARAARRAGTRLVIDESFVDIDLRGPADGQQPIVPMAAFDDGVLSIGSLSKSIWGGLRVGWIRADTETVQRLAAARARTDMAGAVIEQLLACHLFTDLAASLEQRRNALRHQRDVLLAELAEHLPQWRPSRALGGLSCWIELDHPSATPLSHLLEHRGLLLSPGARFAADGLLERYLRLPFALSDDQLRQAVQVIARAWSEIGRPSQAREPRSLLTA